MLPHSSSTLPARRDSFFRRLGIMGLRGHMGHPLVPTSMVAYMGQHKHNGQRAGTNSACSGSVGPLVGKENNSLQMRQPGSGILHTMPLQQRGAGDAAAEMPLYDSCTPQLLPHRLAYCRGSQWPSRCNLTKFPPSFSCTGTHSTSQGYTVISTASPTIQPAIHELDIQQLETALYGFLEAGVAESTARTYRTGERHYLSFCSLTGVNPTAASELQLMRFATFLALKQLSWQTIKTYLAGTRHFLLLRNIESPFQESSLPRLQLLLKGIKRISSKTQRPKTRLPITPDILRKLFSILRQQPDNPDNIMLWAAMNLCFFGFLRSGEICCPSPTLFDPTWHLCVGDISLDHQADKNTIHKAQGFQNRPISTRGNLGSGKNLRHSLPSFSYASILSSARSKPRPLIQICFWLIPHKSNLC